MLEFNEALASNADTLMNIILHAPVVGKRNVINLPASFDTESSSFVDDEMEKCSLCYIWMFGICDEVIYGRELDEFATLIKVINALLSTFGKKLIIYVHNLKYDYHIIRGTIQFDKIFAKSKRNILFANVGNIEFRDSLALAGGKSLEKIGNSLRRPIHKMVGDLDYEKIRTPNTPLTEKEMGYCEHDILVLNEYIREKIEDDGDILQIPYTNTGYVRRDVRDACLKSKHYLDFMDNLTMTAACYVDMEHTFMGGAVGPNFSYVGKLMENLASYDIKSSYPYVMCAYKFPMSYPTTVKNKDAREVLYKVISEATNCSQERVTHLCAFKLEVFSLAPKDDAACYPISVSKCTDKIGEVTIQGRVVTASYISIMCTEHDYMTFTKFYDINESNSRISNLRLFKAAYLPAPIIKCVLKYFNKKTTLDGKKGFELEYMIAKNMLNAIYGMMVEKVVRSEYKLYEGILQKLEPDYIEQIDKYNNKWNRVLYYPWGVWITAYARYRLYDSVYAVGEDFVYCDTDSNKVANYQKHLKYFEHENEIARNIMKELAKRLHHNIDYVIPISPADGKRKCLGVWELEFICKKFKTLGPKRYLLEKDNGKLLLTVSGTHKSKTLSYLLQKAKQKNKSIFDIFNLGITIPAKYSGRLVATFIDEPRAGYVTDYIGNEYFYQIPSGVHMEPAPYTFDDKSDEIQAAKSYLELSFMETDEY